MPTNEKAPAHTPVPWRTDWLGDDRGWILDEQSNYLAEIVTEDDCGFVVPKDEQRANAEFIVREVSAEQFIWIIQFENARYLYPAVPQRQRVRVAR